MSTAQRVLRFRPDARPTRAAPGAVWSLLEEQPARDTEGSAHDTYEPQPELSRACGSRGAGCPGKDERGSLKPPGAALPAAGLHSPGKAAGTTARRRVINSSLAAPGWPPGPGCWRVAAEAS